MSLNFGRSLDRNENGWSIYSTKVSTASHRFQDLGDTFVQTWDHWFESISTLRSKKFLISNVQDYLISDTKSYESNLSMGKWLEIGKL